MADISGAASTFNPASAGVNNSILGGQGGEEQSRLEQLREELREEARAVAREVAQAETSGITNGVAAPDPLNRFTIERSNDADDARPRGFQPEDTEDRVDISEQALGLLAQDQAGTNGAVANGQDRVSAFAPSTSSGETEGPGAVSSDIVARDSSEAGPAFASGIRDDDGNNPLSAVTEPTEATEPTENANANTQPNPQNAVNITADAEASEIVAVDVAAPEAVTIDAGGEDGNDPLFATTVSTENVNTQNTNNSQDTTTANVNSEDSVTGQGAENETNVVNLQPEQQAINAETVVNQNETNQVAANENDTTEVAGNLDQTNQPLGQRVLGQIVDQFA